MSSVAAIVVNYQRVDLLSVCLESLDRSLSSYHGPARAIVVDNGSTDGSVEMLRQRFPSVEVLALGENRGFAAAVNAGLGQADSDWVLLLNNDATIEPFTVAELMQAADAAPPDVGAIAAQLRFADGSERINSAGIDVDRLGVAYDRLLGTPGDDSQGPPVEVFGVSAGAALYRRSMLETLGGFDDSFFLFLEDVDVAWRARMAGWRSLYAPKAVGHHMHSATSGHNSAFKHFYVGRNRVRLIAKNADSRHLQRWGAAMVAYDIAYVLYASIADRTLAPLRGRVRGLREWRRTRRAGGATRTPVALAPVAGVLKALSRRAAWASRPPASASGP